MLGVTRQNSELHARIVGSPKSNATCLARTSALGVYAMAYNASMASLTGLVNRRAAKTEPRYGS